MGNASHALAYRRLACSSARVATLAYVLLATCFPQASARDGGGEDLRGTVETFRLPPVHTLPEAGRLHGESASGRIQRFLQTQEISAVVRAVVPGGALRALFTSLRSRAVAHSPGIGEEIAAIAEGARVEADHVWAVNLVSELQHAQRNRGRGHCSDVFAHDGSGRILHGHNEDWSAEFTPLMYFVVYNAAPGASFRPVGGLVYPGQVPGFAVAFNERVWTSQNSLYPQAMRDSGVPVIAVSRNALQGVSLEECIQRFSVFGQALGMNVNIVAPAVTGPAPGHGQSQDADVEVAGAADRVCTLRVAGNYTHFNVYKCLSVAEEAWYQASSLRRQAAADRFHAPSTAGDVLAILGDTADAEEPVYRNTTMVSILFDSDSTMFQVWLGSNPALTPPAWESSLQAIFSRPAVIV